MTRTDPDRLRCAFEELGRTSLAVHSLQFLIQHVTDVAAHVLPGDPVTSVTILTDGRPRTVAASGWLAADLDETQYRLGSGPCLAAAPSDHATRALATRFASYAVVPVSNMYLYATAVQQMEQLQQALDSRPVIGQAKGILKEPFTLTADRALQELARVSMQTNRKLRDVA